MSLLDHPYVLTPGVLEKKPGFLDLQVRNYKDIAAYRLWMGNVLNDMYGNPNGSGVAGDETGRQMLFQVQKGAWHRSPSIIARRLSYDEVIRGITRLLFDYGDYRVPPLAGKPQPLPVEGVTLLARVQQVRHTTGPLIVKGAINKNDPIMGPILVIPGSPWWSGNNPTINLQGIAPAGTNGVAGTAPIITLDPDQQLGAPPMAIRLPRGTSSLRIRNLDGGGVGLLFSFGWGMPYQTLPAGETLDSFGGITDIVLAGDGGSPPFTIMANIDLSNTGSP